MGDVPALLLSMINLQQHVIPIQNHPQSSDWLSHLDGFYSTDMFLFGRTNNGYYYYCTDTHSLEHPPRDVSGAYYFQHYFFP